MCVCVCVCVCVFTLSEPQITPLRTTRLTLYLPTWKKRTKKSENTFLSNAPRFPLQHDFLEGSQVKPVCPTGKSSTWIKRSMEHWWNDSDRGITEALGENHVSVPVSLPKISHGPAWSQTQASAARGRRQSAWDMARPLETRISTSYT
jgi:hypothetical protein